MYDIIPDIHGHSDKLTGLLEKLGYRERNNSWRHTDPGRQCIFLGDYIDRGPDNAGVIDIVRRMVDAGTAPLASVVSQVAVPAAWQLESVRDVDAGDSVQPTTWRVLEGSFTTTDFLQSKFSTSLKSWKLLTVAESLIFLLHIYHVFL